MSSEHLENSTQPPPEDRGWMTRERLLALVLIFATALGVYLCYRIVRPFLPALAGALALAVIARPVHDWLTRMLNPVIVGNRLRLHTLLAFFAIVGGLALFGAAGLVLGPLVVSITVALLEVWRKRTAEGRTAEEAVHA